MTKQEERQILAQIEKLIASAGEESYIGFAFAGCVEMARGNIENDFANSMQEALVTARRNAKTENELRNAAQDALLEAQKELNQAVADIGELQQQLKAEKQKQLPAGLYRDLRSMLEDQEKNAQQELTNASIHLAAFADHPEDIAVAHGLKQLNAAVNKRTKAHELLTRLAKYEPK